MATQAKRGDKKPLFTTTVRRHEKDITENYVRHLLKAARFTIGQQYVTRYPIGGDYYEATVEVYELLPGY